MILPQTQSYKHLSLHEKMGNLHDMTADLIHMLILNLHCLSPLIMVCSVTTSTGCPSAPSNNAFAQPREQLHQVAEALPRGILFTKVQ